MINLNVSIKNSSNLSDYLSFPKDYDNIKPFENINFTEIYNNNEELNDYYDYFYN